MAKALTPTQQALLLVLAARRESYEAKPEPSVSVQEAFEAQSHLTAGSVHRARDPRGKWWTATGVRKETFYALVSLGLVEDGTCVGNLFSRFRATLLGLLVAMHLRASVHFDAHAKECLALCEQCMRTRLSW